MGIKEPADYAVALVPIPRSRCDAETHWLRSPPPRSPCDGMMNDRQGGEQRTCSRGRFDMREAVNILYIQWLCLLVSFQFCPSVPAAGSLNAMSLGSSRGRFEGLPLVWRLTGGGSQRIVFQRERFDVLNPA